MIIDNNSDDTIVPANVIRQSINMDPDSPRNSRVSMVGLGKNAATSIRYSLTISGIITDSEFSKSHQSDTLLSQ